MLIALVLHCLCGCRAPVHSYRHTRREIKAALGVDIEQLFDSFDPQPLASGSIAQVHRATLKAAPYKQYLQQHYQQSAQPQPLLQDEAGQQEQQVVVKVCHPSVAEHIRMDFKLVGWLSIAASKLPLLRGLPVRESVAQFSHTMTAQADLRVEAVHALRFHNNFAGRLGRCIHGCSSSWVTSRSASHSCSCWHSMALLACMYALRCTWPGLLNPLRLALPPCCCRLSTTPASPLSCALHMSLHVQVSSPV